MFSRETTNPKVTGNYFYRMIGECFTGLNYLHKDSDIHVPNAFVWMNKDKNMIGGTLTEITYKQNATLVSLDDFYSTKNTNDPTQTEEWHVFHGLRHFMRPIQIPTECKGETKKSDGGICTGRSFTWFFHPRDFSKEMRIKLKTDLESVLANYNSTSTNGKYQLDGVTRINGFSITEPAVNYAHMSYPGNTDTFDRNIGRVEVIIYYE
jgi:hypothetical protein